MIKTDKCTKYKLSGGYRREQAVTGVECHCHWPPYSPTTGCWDVLQLDLEHKQNKNGNEYSMSVLEEVPSLSKLHSLFMYELNNIEITPRKKSMTQSIEETLVGAFELEFQSTNTGIKSTFTRFLKMDLMDMVYNETMDNVLIRSIDRFSHSNAILNAPTERYTGNPLWHKTSLDPWAVQQKEKLKTDSWKTMTSSTIHYHQSQNTHQRRVMLV